MLASQHWSLRMSFGKETPCPHETPALRVKRCAEQSAAANAAAFVHMAELTMLESLEVSGWEDPGASADLARLRQLTALTSLTLTTSQYPRYIALTEVCMLRPEGHHNTCLSPEMECHTLQLLPSSVSHAACASRHGLHSYCLCSQQLTPDDDVSRALSRRA